MTSAFKNLSRREATKVLAGVLVSPSTALPLVDAQTRASQASQDQLNSSETAFLDEMQHAACLYFSEQRDPATGQVLDRAINRTATCDRDPRTISSIAATGFGLTALCIADKRSWLASGVAAKQVLIALQFHLNKMPHQHGFFYHFNHVHTGQPVGNSEISSIDTAILLCGVLTCRAYFQDEKICDLATQLYNRVDWPWMLNGGDTFSMGWHTASGFLFDRWDHYSELMMIYLLAIGSPTHPVPASTWNNFTRPRMRFAGFNYISGRDPLFVHLYSHAWFDFAHKRDAYTNYFTNSILATRAHKAFCLSLGRGYNDDYWGITASDWQHGYTAWGGPTLIGPVDGSVVPCATAGSLPFLPVDCIRVLRSLKARYGKDAWGRYGFCDAFHPSQFWYDPDVLGIDLGIGLLMAENLRTGFVWQTFMQNPEPNAAMRSCGFHTS
jgi:hypothetical protein